MTLSLEDHRAMLAGFADAGYQCLSEPARTTNPVQVEWRIDGQVKKFRLWAFDVTHGGGGAEVRAADEFRIQITNGPEDPAQFDQGDAIDLLLGYSRDRHAIVAYDRRWLEAWSRKKHETGSGGSPSVQVKEADIQAAEERGTYHISKKSRTFGQANIVTMSPAMLPGYLLNHDKVLRGDMTGEEAQATTPPTASAVGVVDYCQSQGFPFHPDLVARYLASMLTKPFVILAGVSGTGKSKLAELVAEYYTLNNGASATPSSATAGIGESFVFSAGSALEPDRSRFALVAVRPDWIDNQSIFGFLNPITERYESTQALDLILRAKAALESSDDAFSAPRYFVLLDEMNLARVEHYFSDWLACTESRRLRSNQSMVQQPVPLHRSKEEVQVFVEGRDGLKTMFVPSSLELPTNLVVTGTVNVDETTYGFSPKVLDRAMVIEFDEVDLDGLRHGAIGADASEYRFPEALPDFQLASAADYATLPALTHAHILEINKILEPARLHVGYRAANEMALFISIYNSILPEAADDEGFMRALDVAILQKVLPRLNGNRAKLEAPLAILCSYLRDLAQPTADVRLETFDPQAPAGLPRSYARAVEMLDGLRDFGFVSFFK